jgi:hypothetical protein
MRFPRKTCLLATMLESMPFESERTGKLEQFYQNAKQCLDLSRLDLTFQNTFTVGVRNATWLALVNTTTTPNATH